MQYKPGQPGGRPAGGYPSRPLKRREPAAPSKPVSALAAVPNSRAGDAGGTLTVMCDASSINHNPYLGEQLAEVFKLCKAAGMGCQYVQDATGLQETASVSHELDLIDKKK